MKNRNDLELVGDCNKDVALAVVCFFFVLALVVPAFTFLSECASTASANTGDGRAEFVDLNALADSNGKNSSEGEAKEASDTESAATNASSAETTSKTQETNTSVSTTVPASSAASSSAEDAAPESTSADNSALAAPEPSAEGPAQSEDVCIGDVVFK